MTNNISWRDKDSSDLHVLRDGEKLRVGVMMRGQHDAAGTRAKTFFGN